MFSHGNHWLSATHPGGTREVERKWNTKGTRGIPQPAHPSVFHPRPVASHLHSLSLLFCSFFPIFSSFYWLNFSNSTHLLLMFKSFHSLKPAKAPSVYHIRNFSVCISVPSAVVSISPILSYMILPVTSQSQHYYYLNSIALVSKIHVKHLLKITQILSRRLGTNHVMSAATTLHSPLSLLYTLLSYVLVMHILIFSNRCLFSGHCFLCFLWLHPICSKRLWTSTSLNEEVFCLSLDIYFLTISFCLSYFYYASSTPFHLSVFCLSPLFISILIVWKLNFISIIYWFPLNLLNVK